MRVHITTTIAPKEPVPTLSSALPVTTHWEVDEDEWDEYGLDFDGEQYTSPTIGTREYQFDWLPYSHDPESIIEYISDVFANYPVTDDDEEDLVYDAPGDPYVALEAAGYLYNALQPDDLGAEAIEKLGDPENWYETGNRTFTVES